MDLDLIDEHRSSKSFQLLIAGVAPSVDMRFLAPAAVTGSLDLKLATHHEQNYYSPRGNSYYKKLCPDGRIAALVPDICSTFLG
jgi:hypothetical protein